MSYYTVTALDADGCEVGSYESGPNRRTASQEARASLNGDGEWIAAGMVRVTVTDEGGVIWDDLRRAAAVQLCLGKRYRVKALRLPEYLTVGEVYVCDALSHDSVGLHRLNNGPGTYLALWRIDQGYVQLEEAGSAE